MAEGGVIWWLRRELQQMRARAVRRVEMERKQRMTVDQSLRKELEALKLQEDERHAELLVAIEKAKPVVPAKAQAKPVQRRWSQIREMVERRADEPQKVQA
jgi:hypothetical protein